MTAFEFDACISYVLQVHDNERDAERLKIQLRGIAIILGANPESFAEQDADAEAW